MMENVNERDPSLELDLIVVVAFLLLYFRNLPDTLIALAALGVGGLWMLGLLAAWAEGSGVDCPEQVLATYRAWLERAASGRGARETILDQAEALATCDWIVRIQPYGFGYAGWSPIAEVLRDLQLRGRAAELAEGID